MTLKYDAATLGATYKLIGSHAGILEISDPCTGCQNEYVDYYDYSAYTGDNVDAPGEYEFFPQGQSVPAHQAVPLGTTYEVVQATVPAACNDVRDQIIGEYVTVGVAYRPTCNVFTQTASTTHFTFSELNTGSYTWAILQSYFLTGIEVVRTDNGSVSLIVNSAYRNPKKQIQINPNAPNSRHVYGDAVDFASNSSTWPGLHNAGKRAGGCVEPVVAQGNSQAHCHIDFRGACPLN